MDIYYIYIYIFIYYNILIHIILHMFRNGPDAEWIICGFSFVGFLFIRDDRLFFITSDLVKPLFQLLAASGCSRVPLGARAP